MKKLILTKSSILNIAVRSILLQGSKVVLLFVAFLLLFSSSFAQKNASIFGLVKDSLGRDIPDVNIQVIGKNMATTTNEVGYYSLSLPANEAYELNFSYVGSPKNRYSVRILKEGEKFKLDVRLNSGVMLNDFVFQEEREREKVSMYTIDPRKTSYLPNVGGSFEQILKTLPGVSSNNELSAQYNVRGGNFDENLVYVNDIEIYRPFLPRSGQQEGLSFIHSELVQNVKFSAGGFEARYGDKMSSVLDIKYKDPKKFASSLNLGLLGAQTHVEGASKNLRFSYLLGARYWTNKYVVGTLDTKGDYQPSFTDVQTLLTYHLSDKLSVSVLGSYAQNRYFLQPQDRETTFGTVKQVMQLKVYFDGADLMEYRTATGAATLVYKPSNKTQLKFLTSTFYSNENEYFTIEGAYRLSEIETNQGSDNFGKAKSLRGVGYFINDARNTIQAYVFNAGHRGYHSSGKNNIQWGAFIQNEIIYDSQKEWNYRDSAGFSQPGLSSNGDFALPYYLKTKLSINSFRINGYIQNSQTLSKSYNAILTYGLRSNWWSFNNENVVSPRIQFSFEPNRLFNRNIVAQKLNKKPRKDWVIKAAYGWYYQPPFYRELRNFDGVLNPNIKAQLAIHYVIGADMNFKAWGRPFKFVSEAYYKQLENIIPYEIDNVRIRYFAENTASGSIKGVDFRVNGEFVKGTESWASLSFMDAKEIISNQKDVAGNPETPRYIPRPTNQFMQFAITFQDYLANNPSNKVFLTLVYGSGLPFGPPDRNRYNDVQTMPSYKRVDIGFGKDLIRENEKERNTFFKRHINTCNLSLEVFNLLGVNNTISYTWLDDANGQRWAVPNYLTSRRLNLRLLMRF